MSWGIVELEPEVQDWLESLSTAQFATAAFYVNLVADRGPLLGEPYTRLLDGKLRELRFHFGRSGRAGDVLDRVWLADRAADGVREDADAGGGRGRAGASGDGALQGAGAHGGGRR